MSNTWSRRGNSRFQRNRGVNWWFHRMRDEAAAESARARADLYDDGPTGTAPISQRPAPDGTTSTLLPDVSATPSAGTH